MKVGAKGEMAKSKVACIDDASAAAARGWWRRLQLCWRRVARMAERAPRRLRLCESLPLGERRFVAVIEFEKARFLVGGTPASLSLLARLGRDGGSANERAANSLPSPEAAQEIPQPDGKEIPNYDRGVSCGAKETH
jgi:Flagellar biosynthesis protein, FliO